MQKKTLLVIQSTDSPIKEFLRKGHTMRLLYSLEQYAKEFEVHYYTCDTTTYQNLMPAGVLHHRPLITSKYFGIRHILYYIYLIILALKWRKTKKVSIRVIGINVPAIVLFRKIINKPIVASYQFDWASGMKTDYRGIKPLVSGIVQKMVINSADELICTMQWLSDIAQQRYGKDADKITIIPNYVDTNVFKPNAIKEKQIVFAGRLHWSKGIYVLIDAFKKFRQQYPDYKLIIMGSGEDELALKQKAEGVTNISFTGPLPNARVAEYFNASEIFVLPTVNAEGHPRALVEAMASGCKCIASNVPGNKHVLTESNTAQLLFDSGNVQMLYEKLVYCVNQEVTQQYEFALKNYSANVCFEKELAVLNRLLN